MGMPVQTDRLARFAELTSVSRETQTLEEMFQRMTSVDPVTGRVEGLPTICKSWDVPYGRVLTWLMADAKRYAVYERALEVAAHALVSEVVPIADEVAGALQATEVSAARLRVDARFRVASFHAREKYGEQVKAERALPAVTINIGVRSSVPAGPVIEQEASEDGEI